MRESRPEQTIAVPYFDGRELRLLEPPADAAGEAALGRFLRLGVQDRLRDSRHLLAYWEDMREAAGAEDIDALAGPVPDDPARVWDRVRPVGLIVSTDRDDTPVVALEAGCPWEDEHGLNMVWRDGAQLVRVGPCDGHFDNMIWRRGPGLDRVVYQGGREERHTWRDEEA